MITNPVTCMFLCFGEGCSNVLFLGGHGDVTAVSWNGNVCVGRVSGWVCVCVGEWV